MFNDIKNHTNVHCTARIPFRITDHNYGDHVANNVFVEYLHEGRVQLLSSIGFTERGLGGSSLILSELIIKYTKQAFYPGELRLEMAFANLRPTRFDVYYRGFDATGDLLLLAKTQMACIEARSGRPTRLSEELAKAISALL